MAKRSMGRFDRKIILESPAPLDDGHGGTEEGWQVEFTTAARYTRSRSGDQVLKGRLEGVNVTFVRVRSTANTRRIGTDWRALDARTPAGLAAAYVDDQWTGEIFRIGLPIETDDGQWIDLPCRSGVET